MTEEQKIRAAHDYLIYNCSYADDWSTNRANTAYGALVYHEAQCSGYSRAFKALCDSIDLECLYIHANQSALNPDHQWNMVKLNGEWYFIDVQGNDSVGYDIVYLTAGTLMSYDTTGYPQTAQTDAPVMRYTFQEGPYAGTVIPTPLSLTEAQKLEFNFYPSESLGKRDVNGYECDIIPSDSSMVKLTSNGGLDLEKYDLRMELFAVKGSNLLDEAPELMLEHTSNKLNVDAPFTLDFTGQNRDTDTFREYCKENNIVIVGFVYDANQLLAFAQKNGGYAGIEAVIFGEIPVFEVYFCYQ